MGATIPNIFVKENATYQGACEWSSHNNNQHFCERNSHLPRCVQMDRTTIPNIFVKETGIHMPLTNKRANGARTTMPKIFGTCAIIEIQRLSLVSQTSCGELTHVLYGQKKK